MTIELTYAKLRKGKCGTFRPLKTGELIEANDVIVGSNGFYDYPSDKDVGQPCNDKDVIIRLEFE